jgi:hypothetical protein
MCASECVRESVCSVCVLTYKQEFVIAGQVVLSNIHRVDALSRQTLKELTCSQ